MKNYKRSPAHRDGRIIQFVFTATLALSAVLLFWVQPMFAKMVLPLLGGAPAVWNTSMVFFQAVLLAGYGDGVVTGSDQQLSGNYHMKVV